MARGEFRIIDADGHVMEPSDMWARYIDPAYRAQAPRVAVRPDGRSGFESAGTLSPRFECVSTGMRAAFAARIREHMGEYLAAQYDSASQLRAMDEGGIEMAFLYPTQGLYVAAIDGMDPGLAIAICRAYNDWLVDFCAADPARLKPAGMLTALHDPAAAVREVERLATRGFRAVFVRPNPIHGRNLDAPAYEPLWAACARLGIGVGVHEGVGAFLPEVGADRFHTFFATHSASHPMEQSSRCWR